MAVAVVRKERFPDFLNTQQLSTIFTTIHYSIMSDLPKPVVFCGPSGVGKGTLIEMLMKRFPNDQFGFSVSHTTRKPREGEIDGKHYNFTTVETMKQEIDEGKFVEYAEVHGNYYGTSIAAVEAVRKENRICILDIDIQGVMKVKESSLKPIYLFIAPPSMDELEKRLRGRGTETEDAIKKRLGNAKKELDYGQQSGNFDRIFVNADLEATFEELVASFKEWYPELDEVAPDDDPKNCTSNGCWIS
ncbi:guanylate kinase [Nitzschia inconspicua]|uniref:guanylate kinase n=1 Tax=Nitzschia inconspicua TaxID=303405 RepID=A0A9K3LQU3_9STRA|nr:guanylate kinase [Nitzschia inconspicua]